VLVFRDAPRHGPSTDSAFHVPFSDDEGRTWTDEGILDPEGIAPASPLLGQDEAVDPATGDLHESVFVAREGGRSGPFNTGLVRTGDGGRSWEYVGDVTDFEDGTNETGIAFVDGDLLAVLRHADSEEMYARRSPDAGETWGPLRTVTDSVGVVQRPRLYTPGDAGSEAHHDEWVYAVGRHVHPGDSMHTAVAASDNAGETWDVPSTWTSTATVATVTCSPAHYFQSLSALLLASVCPKSGPEGIHMSDASVSSA